MDANTISRGTRTGIALQDLLDSIRRPEVWFVLGVEDFRQPYERSVAGILWAMLQPAAWVAAIGTFFAPLLADDPADYVVHIAVGIVVYNFLTASLTASGNVFVVQRNLIRNFPLPLLVHILRAMMRCVCRFGMQALLIIVVFAVLMRPPGPWSLLVIPATALVIVAGVAASLLVSIITARFGDMQHAVASLMSLLFFATPIIWFIPESGAQRTLALLNPMTHFIEIIRGPLAGTAPDPLSWAVAISCTLLALVIGFVLFALFRNQILLWTHQ